MTKAQREKAERLLLKERIDSNPKLKAMLDAMIDNPKPELIDMVKPVIEEALKKAQADGINIGMIGSALIAMNHIKDMQTIDEVKAYFQKQEDDARARMNLPKVEMDEENQG